jgi:hypothetical protein
MRKKKIWGCAVAAALATLGGGLAVDYACEHPESWLGRCFTNAQDVAVYQVKAQALTGHTAGLAFEGVRGFLGQGTGAVCDDGAGCAGHEAPAADEGCAMQPAVLPGGVVMHEDPDALPAQPLPPVQDLIGGSEPTECMPMPRAEDDAAKMPRAGERDDR